MIVFHRNKRGRRWRPQLHFAEYRAREQIAFAPSIDPALVTKPQGEAAILVHLVAAAHEARGATLRIGGQVIPGKLELPEIDRLVIPFRPLAGPGLALPGEIATVHYTIGPDEYRFKSRVTRRPAGWWLSLPRLIQGTSRRLAPRHQVHGSWRLDLRQGGPLVTARSLPILDASASGLALRAVEGAGDQLRERILSGVLRDVTGLAVPVQVQVRYVGVEDDAWQGAVLGCAFRNIGYTNQVRVSEALRDHQVRRARRETVGEGVPDLRLVDEDDADPPQD